MLSFIMALVAGAVRLSTPFLFVSLGETITEKSGRINLGLEGILVFGALSGFGASYLSGSALIGVVAAGIGGALLGAIHGWLCGRPGTSSIAVGIAMMVFGLGISFYLGKPLIQPKAPQLPDIDLGWWATSPAVRAALRINLLFVLGLLMAPFLRWAFRSTRYGLIVRMAGENAQAARAAGYSVECVRLLATMAGGALGGIGGSFLSLYYPGAWTEGLSSGQGLMAVALVIFARWDPMRCLWASLIFGAAGSLGVALQSIGISQGFHLFNAAPAMLTLIIMTASSSTSGNSGRPRELTVFS